MDVRAQLSASDDVGRRGLAVSLGVTQADDAYDTESQIANVRRAAIMLPAALLAQLVTLALLLTAALGLQAQMFGIRTLAIAATAFVLTLAVMLYSRTDFFRRTPPHQLILGALPCSGALGACLALLAFEIAPHSGEMIGILCMVALGLAAIMLFFALVPIQATALIFVAGAIIAATVRSGEIRIGVIGFALFVCFWLASVVTARFDGEQTRKRARADNKARRANRLLEEFEANGNGWFWETDRSGHLVYLSPKLVETMGRPKSDILGAPFTSLIWVEAGQEDAERTLGFHLSTRSAFNDVAVRAAVDGDELWWSVSGRPIIDEIGQFRGYAGSGTDLTEKRRSEEEVNRLARYDALTGLANRQQMRLALKRSLEETAGRSANAALMLLDLDRFKAVNDTMGHPVGDELLKQVAARLFRTVGDRGMVGRLGGDEFEVVLPDYVKPDRLSDLARRIISELSQPYMIEGDTLTIGCSIGIAIAPANGTASDELVRNADLALYAAKADGRGVHRFYKTEMHAGAKQRKSLEDDLRLALSRDELAVFYQPQVSTTSEKIVGYEALIRWQHPTRGAISPAEFVPVAEDIGLIEPIGQWVLRRACKDAAKWPGLVRVAVNVSPMQFVNPEFSKIVLDALDRAGLPPERLELELTETVFLDEDHDTATMFRTLKQIGVRLALDDFGTGYSALGYLRTAPFDKIKIDQSFIRGAAVIGNRNAAIIKSIVTLAETLSMETTAEGVEHIDEIALVRELGCSHIQGYIYGKPMTHMAVMAQLEDGAGVAAVQSNKVSRSPRKKLLRSANVELAGRSYRGLIRNISATGAMIEGLGEVAPGTDIMVEVIAGEMQHGTVRWSKDNQLGLQFAEVFDLERLNVTAKKPRVTGNRFALP